jgi:GNAT superfamily N-acetyltransferase
MVGGEVPPRFKFRSVNRVEDKKVIPRGAARMPVGEASSGLEGSSPTTSLGRRRLRQGRPPQAQSQTLEFTFAGQAKRYRLVDFIPREAPNDLWQAYFGLSEVIFRELAPGDRLPDRGTMRRFLSTPNPLYRVKRWLLFNDAGRAIASTWMGYETDLSPDFESNKRICQVRIVVASAHRRRKIATLLLNHVCDIAVSMGRVLVMAEVDNALAVSFCTSLRGELVHEEVQHRLMMKDIDWNLVGEWLGKGRTKARDVGIELFQECPEADIEEFTRVYTEIINQRPTGGMEQELRTTPESRRIEEHNLRRRGIEWYTMISREPTGEISGVTDIMYNPEEPHRINQYFTGVLSKYRRRGLAKRLKAEMLKLIKEDFPDVEYVTTNTARTNLPMRAMNRRLGFRPHKTLFIFQWAMVDLKARLDELLFGFAYSWPTG